MNYPWFRAYTDLVDNYKLRLLAFEDRWHYVAILCCKGAGLLDGKRPDFVRRVVAIKLGLAQAELDEVVRRLSDVNLIDAKTMQPVGWNERQFESDNSTDRVRKYRKNKKSGNVSETSQKRFGNGPYTDTDTEEIHTAPNVASPVGGNASKARFDAKQWLQMRGVDSDVATAWLTVRRTKKLANTQLAFEKVEREATLAGLSLADAIRVAAEKSWGGFSASWPRDDVPQAPVNRFAGSIN